MGKKCESYLRPAFKFYTGSFSQYVDKIFRKANISYPLIRIIRVRIRGYEKLVFRKILRMWTEWMISTENLDANVKRKRHQVRDNNFF